jgi:Phospholipase_D-nuclease N-terminal
MADRRRWSDLSARSRRLIIGAAVAEASLKTAALIDIRRRPASEIRGSKWAWAAVVLAVNSFGGAPLSYFAFGRRRQSRSQPD